MDKNVHPPGEAIFSSNPFWVRLVRVFRGSICFFQDYFRELGSTCASRIVFGALAEHIARGSSIDGVVEGVRIPVAGAPTGAAEAAALPNPAGAAVRGHKRAFTLIELLVVWPVGTGSD